MTGLSIDGSSAGAVTMNDGAGAADLNKGAGGDYIFLHADYAEINSYKYVERSWDTEKRKVTKTTKTCTSFTSLTSNTGNTNTVLTDGWYVLDRNVEYNKYLDIDGDVKIILTDGRVLNAKNNIRLNTGCKLTVYAQEGYGRIYACGNHGPGIGAYGDIVAGSLEIHGGIINAQAGSSSNAGIGAGNGGGSGYQSITIYGGTVTAIGEYSGAGIGAGEENKKANLGLITIYGGTVVATGGSWAAGIGGGEESTNPPLYIYGGKITATGGNGGSGIGGGEDECLGNNVYIRGGANGCQVYAYGGQTSDAIGSRDMNIFTEKAPTGEVVIDNATVTAYGGIDAFSPAVVGNGIQAESITVGNSTVKIEGRKAMKANGYGLANNMRVNDKAKDKRFSALSDESKLTLQPCNHERHGNDPVTYTNRGNGKHSVDCYYCDGPMEDHIFVFDSTNGYFCEKCYAAMPEEEVYDVIVATYNENLNVYQATNHLVCVGSQFALPPCDNLTDNTFAGWAVIPSLQTLYCSPLLASRDDELLPAGLKIKVEEQGIMLAA